MNAFGKSFLRNEDRRLLTGKALFVDDVDLPNMLHVAFVRSEHAHALIKSIHTDKALKREGVVAVYTAHDLKDYWQHGPLLVPPPPIKRCTFNARTQVPLAKDRVRHTGEPIVAIVAQSRYIAEDAIDDIEIDYEPLSSVQDLEKALKEDSPLVHDDLPSNIAADVTQEKGDYEQAKSQAKTVVKRKFFYDHGIAAAMENRGVVANWCSKEERMTVWDTTQAPIPIRNGLAKMLGLSQSQIRVIAPFLGGGFGPKMMMFYPEEVLIPWISMKLEQPIKWIEDRQENFFATTHERGQLHEAELALSEEGKILGVKDSFLYDSGAYSTYGLTVPINSQCTLMGPYRVPNYLSHFKAIFTNRTLVTPYRGAGRQHGVFVMERLLDIAAREIGMDRVKIRKLNMLNKDEFPHEHEIIFQDFMPLVYDSGDYHPALEKAVSMIGYDDFLKQQKPNDDKLLGIGIVSYIEGTGIGPYEGACITLEPSGHVSVCTGIGTQGQGHFTSFAQIVSEQIGVSIDKIHLVTGDTDRFHWGSGTFASRGAVVAGNACHAAAKAVREKIIHKAAQLFDQQEQNINLKDGFAYGQDNKSISLGELAALSNPLRGAVTPGTDPGIEATKFFGPKRGATASGVHAMIVEVCPNTMMIKIKKYVVVHDCGKVINPMIVEGQIHGGVVQGIGNAFYEQIIYDDSGQLQTASFMDYLLPTSTDVVDIECAHLETPSPLNELGVKGVGEAGAIPVGPLFAQAIEDALRKKFPHLEILEIPLSPKKLFELCEGEKK